MAEINVTNLTFAYEGSFDNIFEDVSFTLDTDWKLGFIGRNGKGKTTFLRLLMGDYEYTGSIRTNAHFDFFPYPLSEGDLEKTADEMLEYWKPDAEAAEMPVNWQRDMRICSMHLSPAWIHLHTDCLRQLR